MTRHLSVTSRYFRFRAGFHRRHDRGQGENVEGKGCRLAFVEHANARVRKRERERGRERNSFLVREWAVRCRGRRWPFPLGRSQRVTGYIHLEILPTNTPGSKDRWQETWIAKRDRVRVVKKIGRPVGRNSAASDE